MKKAHWLVTSKKAHYIAVVKRNQPVLHAQVWPGLISYFRVASA